MDLREEILKDRSKENMIRLASILSEEKSLIEKLLNLIRIEKEESPAIRLAWLIQHLDDFNQKSLIPYQKDILEILEDGSPFDGVKRALVRALSMQTIKEEKLGIAAEICFNYLHSAEESIAVKVHAMTVLWKIVQRIPELRDELIFSLEEQFPYQSAGFQSRARKILKKLRVEG